MVFMMDKSLVIIIFMYLVSFSMLGAQYLFADVFGITLTNQNGQVLKSNVWTFIKYGNLNSYATQITAANQTVSFTNAVGQAGLLGWDLVTLATGTYIFNILVFFGVPYIIVWPLVLVYIILLGRSIMGWIRGI